MQHYYRFMAIFVVVALLAAGADVLLRLAPTHDIATISDLNIIQSTIDRVYLTNGRVPRQLAGLSFDAKLRTRLASYTYTATGARTYRLCATFETSHASHVPSIPGQPDPNNHAKGPQCFTYTELSIK